MKKWLFFLLILLLSKPIISKEWTNWLGNQSCNPTQYYEPKNLNDLSCCIKKAVEDGCKIRAVGRGFSISDLVCSEGCLINLKNLNNILSIDVGKKLVKVEAGISIGELNELLAFFGLALSNQAAISNLSLGGAIATASHGTGHTGTLSSFVNEVNIVLADGSMRVLSNLFDQEGFAAARANLGALGIVYAVTLECEPLFYLESISYESDIDILIKNYQEFYEANDFFQFTWNVASKKVIIDCFNRTCGTNNTLAKEICYKCLNCYTINNEDKDLFSEIAIPIDFLPKALRALKTFINKYQRQGVDIADIVVRFAELDENCYLSTAADHSVAYITMSAPINSDLTFYKEFEKLMLKYHGRPHWGKINFLDYEKTLKLYGSNLENFIKVRERLDPQHVFSNNFIERVLNPNN